MATSRGKASKSEPPPVIPRRLTHRHPRTLLTSYDPDLSHVDRERHSRPRPPNSLSVPLVLCSVADSCALTFALCTVVADEALDDLAEPRKTLLKALCPKISKLGVLSTTPGGAQAAITKYLVVNGGKGEGSCVVTVGPVG